MPSDLPEAAAFDFVLPRELIAQHPPRERDGGRLLVLDRRDASRCHARVRDLPDWLRAGDLLIVNATRVLAARLRGSKSSGGAAEALILGSAADVGECHYRALLRCRGKLRVGLKLCFGPPESVVDAEVVAVAEAGEVTLRFPNGTSPYAFGEPPLPPYIRRTTPEPEDALRYQTLFARVPGAVAAPTAGLHLSESLLSALAERGVERAEVVLHVGAGTFRPLERRHWDTGRLHPERFELDAACAEAIDRTRRRGGRLVAVGTTVTRVLETCATTAGRVVAKAGDTELFLRPGADFRVVDAMLTNFHLPKSSLLMLVAAFAGREPILDAYAEAVERGYRFYSYGDAMLIV